MNCVSDTLLSDSSEKAATIYRAGALNYTFVCDLCPESYFTNASDIFDHIESHFFNDEIVNVSEEYHSNTAELKAHSTDKSTSRNNVTDASDKTPDDSPKQLPSATPSEHHCEFCSFVCHTTSEFVVHLTEDHSNVTKWGCSICSASFICKSEFVRHLQEHDPSCTSVNLPEIISKCQSETGLCVELQVEECNDVELLLQCDICGGQFESKNQLRVHMKKEHIPQHSVVVKRGVYTCDHCKRNIHGKLLFYAHQYEHLMAGSNQQLDDNVDDASLMEKLKMFLNENILYDESAPDKAFGCKICCHLSVKRRKNIETHILQEHVHRLKSTKRSEKRFPCEFCGQKFTLLHNKIVHKRIHTQEKPYKCLICNKSFSHSSYMKYHENVHTGRCTYQCATCGVSFKSKPKLNQHTKIHSTETTKCPICAKEFKAHRLNVHIKHVHHNEHRPYKCTECLQAFKTAKTLKTHSYRHSGEKKYECRFHCNERFTSTAGRRGHERSKHETH